ncbi:MAG: ankyrin repeat domain-containing protein [Verrucomicrobiales bacterium]|jgi:ankyrin repeat protein|nr:ankyrin repeat domain-containing protein [Verrucomicrobiales bacterium]
MKHLKTIAVLLLGLALCSCKKQADVARETLQGKQIPVSVEEFLKTARQGQLDNLQLFLQTGIDVNTADANGETAFGLAVGAGQKEAADFLLRHGADLNHANHQGRTALMTNTINGKADAVEYLLKAGANDELQDRQGRTALFLSIRHKQPKITELLLRSGAALNLADKEGRTPLGIAPNIATVNALLKAGAKPGPEGIQGQPFLVWAVATGNLELVSRLLESGADPNTLANTPAGNAFVNTVGDGTVEFYLRKEKGVTPLMIAAGQGNLDMVKLLVKHGARKTAGTVETETRAVYIAATNKRTPVIQYLLGANGGQKFKIEISISRQRAVIYKEGEIYMKSPVSTGAKGFDTPKGQYVITDKHEQWISSIYKDAEMPFFMRLNFSPIGMHAGLLPGYPASHGCIRMPYDKAKELFGEIGIGTQVSIVD